MYNHETGLFQDPHLPEREQLVDGYGKRGPDTEWEQDLITLVSEHEEITEDQYDN